VEKGLEEEGEQAGRALARLRAELSQVTEVPVLIAVDEVTYIVPCLVLLFPPLFDGIYRSSKICECLVPSFWLCVL
jgi:hypothetical protein